MHSALGVRDKFAINSFVSFSSSEIIKRLMIKREGAELENRSLARIHELDLDSTLFQMERLFALEKFEILFQESHRHFIRNTMLRSVILQKKSLVKVSALACQRDCKF